MKRDPKWRSFEDYLQSLPKGQVVAELGVYHGTKTRIVWDILKPKKMVWVDWWAEYSNANQPQSFWDQAKVYAEEKFEKELKTDKIEVFHTSFVKAAPKIADETFDFIRHDADEREVQVIETLRAWWPKLKPGGIWMGHGFERRPPYSGTIPAVTTHLREELEAELLGVLWTQSHFVLRKGD